MKGTGAISDDKYADKKKTEMCAIINIGNRKLKYENRRWWIIEISKKMIAGNRLNIINTPFILSLSSMIAIILITTQKVNKTLPHIFPFYLDCSYY